MAFLLVPSIKSFSSCTLPSLIGSQGWQYEVESSVTKQSKSPNSGLPGGRQERPHDSGARDGILSSGGRRERRNVVCCRSSSSRLPAKGGKGRSQSKKHPGRQKLSSKQEVEDGDMWSRSTGEVAAVVSAFDERNDAVVLVEGRVEKSEQSAVPSETREGMHGRLSIFQSKLEGNEFTELSSLAFTGTDSIVPTDFWTSSVATRTASVPVEEESRVESGRRSGKVTDVVLDCGQLHVTGVVSPDDSGCAGRRNLESASSGVQSCEDDCLSSLPMNFTGQEGNVAKVRETCQDLPCSGEKQELLASGAKAFLKKKRTGGDTRLGSIKEGKTVKSRLPKRVEAVSAVVKASFSLRSMHHALDAEGWGQKLSPWEMAQVLRKVTSVRKAHAFFRWMKGAVRLRAEAYMIMVEKLSMAGDWELLEATMQEMFAANVGVDLKLFTLLISRISQAGEMERAEHWFHKCRMMGIVPDLALCNAMLMAYAEGRELEKAEELMQEMTEMLGLIPDKVTLTTMILAHRGSTREGEVVKVLEEARRIGVRRDVAMYGAALSILADSGRIDEAVQVLDTMWDEDRICPDFGCWDCVIRAMGRENRVGEVVDILRRMATKGCSLGEGAFSTLVLLYGKEKNVEAARGVLSLMSLWNVVPGERVHNALLEALSGVDEVRAALELLEDMREQGIPCGVGSFGSVIAMCGRAGLEAQVDALVAEMEERGVVANVVLYTSVIDTYGRLGRVDKALSVFGEMNEMGWKGNQVTFNVLLHIFVRSGLWREMELLVKEMRRRGLAFDKSTYSTLISGYGQMKKVKKATALFEEMKAAGCRPDLAIFGALVQMFSRDGRIDKIEETLSEMNSLGIEPDDAIYHHVLTAYEKSGMQDHALKISNSLKERGIPLTRRRPGGLHVPGVT